ncbi:4Fe-4S dicluster domain-containing protein [Sabulicella glaciei]|uniref:4Fe-4S dicluster domain-containing protein n=1 Tax=Sabulicella glaciei TaxID=2984948 RepID=A0ABT3NRI3_9PROT|nr:4Fe-4S dicluster domain-containing protein [Roseococcus sp. MDT2-1-1]
MSGGATRRDALRVMGASIALSALAGCDQPDEFGHPLHGRGRGVASEDAVFPTTLELDGLGRGVLVRTRGGHPIKVEGNPGHPGSLGASDVFLESAPLSLHAPERSRHALQRGRPAAPGAVRDAFAGLRGEGLRIVTGPLSSPTLRRLVAEALEASPGSVWHVHDPMADPASQAAALAAFGEAMEVLPDLRAARTVLCLGADPLGHGPAQLALARAWREGRPRLLVAEASPSLTGARADRRLALHPAEFEPLARAIAGELGVGGLVAGATHLAAASLATALREAGPGALVLAGRGQPAAVHAIAHAINAHLESSALRLISPPSGGGEAMAPLEEAMRAGEVSRLLLLDVNPAHDRAGFAAAMGRVAHSAHLGERVDETGRAAAWHLPLAHPLESWGDSRSFDGTPGIRQPVAPHPGGEVRGTVETLLALLDREGTGRDAVRDTWRTVWGEVDFEARWEEALEAGVAGEPAPAASLALRPDWDFPGSPFPPGLAAHFAPDPHLRAGAFAHEAWLQELPRPLTRLSWGNAALVAPETAARLGLAAGDEVELTLGGETLRAPVLPLAGQAVDCVTLPLGFGRRAGGPVGEGRGFHAAALRPADGAWVVPGLALRATGERIALIARESQPGLEPDTAKVVAPGERLPPFAYGSSLHQPWPYPGAAWAMAIDLDACIGCNACAIACQAENNVPVVGPADMARGRGLHWLRVERHDRPEDRSLFQPVPCMHCEKAPCEPVCPVNATVHDHEGLNAMVYPRCIGTRTCSNNCPYKVRRFNFEDHRRRVDTPARNPDVALRPRGVMEKCTYCTHRIQAARAEGRLDTVETACARACPTRAILFGDLNDPQSAVARARHDPRSYLMLEELGTRPRTSYLARVEEGGA